MLSTMHVYKRHTLSDIYIYKVQFWKMRVMAGRRKTMRIECTLVEWNIKHVLVYIIGIINNSGDMGFCARKLPKAIRAAE